MGQAPGAEGGDVRQQPLNRLGAGVRNAVPCESRRIVRTRISETPVSLSIALVQLCARACPVSRDAFTHRPP